jgi:hypothetical protein
MHAREKSECVCIFVYACTSLFARKTRISLSHTHQNTTHTHAFMHTLTHVHTHARALAHSLFVVVSSPLSVLPYRIPRCCVAQGRGYGAQLLAAAAAHLLTHAELSMPSPSPTSTSSPPSPPSLSSPSPSSAQAVPPTTMAVLSLWANARDSALGFYRATGWTVVLVDFFHAVVVLTRVNNSILSSCLIFPLLDPALEHDTRRSRTRST